MKFWSLVFCVVLLNMALALKLPSLPKFAVNRNYAPRARPRTPVMRVRAVRGSKRVANITVDITLPDFDFSGDTEACPDGEYNPGPNCGLEPSCSTKSSHAYPKHTCDCWCVPGTYRRLDTDACVKLEDCYD